ncbi:MAG: 3-hydroxyacyl-CoA dehydrogenase [Dehalococcoidia bacterium]|nr:3-hydroxyacyl-CoA dehydrogenase [Dehalococcoidia bacterium]MQG15555.1 SDR family NAD(P)-dependent oxidoreductase [SAR202 cluster bacterium]|tara:strand:+ start:24350 stop:25264 length:915 start_codon:yes stop_codon:yes gene_type:complete
MRLKGKIALVTGAGGGIGSGVAELMAKQGASVIVNDAGSNLDGTGTSRKSADLVVEKINKTGGVAIPNYESIDNYSACNQIIKSALNEFGKLDIICHTAGILRDRMIFNMTEDEWDRVIQVHLHGAFNIIKNALPHMISQKYGRIVLLASISGLRSTGQANYASAKEAMVGIARSSSLELKKYGITVNAVYPGGYTRMVASIPDSSKDVRQDMTGAAKLLGNAMPEESLDPYNNAAKIVYLCTKNASNISGQVIETQGWDMSLYSSRIPTRHIYSDKQWTLNELENLVPRALGKPEPDLTVKLK